MSQSADFEGLIEIYYSITFSQVATAKPTSMNV